MRPHRMTALLISAASALALLPRAAPGAAPGRPFTVGTDLYDFDMILETQLIEPRQGGSKLQVDVSWLPGTEKLEGLPVLYVTDGNWRRVDHKYVHYLTVKKVIPPVVVVGIGYPEGYDIQRTRLQDFLAGPDDFMKSIEEAVFPVIEKRFRTDPARRALFGASAGGNFAWHRFLRSVRPGAPRFQGYVIASPYFPPAADPARSEVSLGHTLRDLAGGALKDLPAAVYLSYGTDEPDYITGPDAKLFEALDQADLPRLRHFQYLRPGADHYTSTRPTLVDGLRFLWGAEEARGVGLVDLRGRARHGFRTRTQIYDWEQSSAVRKLAFDADPAHALGGAPGCLQATADFSSFSSGRVGITFDHFEDLTSREIVFNLLVPESLAKAKYRLRFFILSTYDWKEDLGEPRPIEKAGWNRFTYRWKGKATNGKPALARSLGVAIEKPDGAPAWKGEIWLDDLSW